MILIGLLLACAATAHADGVVALKTSTFAEFVGSPEPTMVEFYAPWCGHCQSLEPEYKAAAKQLKKEGISIAKVDATEESSLAEKFNVGGYPTLKIFQNGKAVKDYRGPRTASAIAEYMKKIKGTVVTPEESEDEGPEGPEGEDQVDMDEKPYGEEDEEVDGGTENEAIGHVELDQYNFDKVVYSGVFNSLVRIDERYPYGDKDTEYSTFTRKLAGQNKKYNDFLVVQIGVEDFGDKLNEGLAQRFGVAKPDFPTFFLITKAGERINFTASVTASNLAEFVREHLSIFIVESGCIAEFDALVRNFAELDTAAQEAALAKATALEGAVAPEEKTSAAVYIKLIKKTLAKGAKSLADESQRLAKLVGSPAVSDAKKEEIKIRQNIVASFLWKGKEGCLEQFEKIASSFVKASPEQQATLIREGEEIAAQASAKAAAAAAEKAKQKEAKPKDADFEDDAEGESADEEEESPEAEAQKSALYYVEVMKNQSKDAAFIQTEAKRVSDLLKAEGITEEKEDELTQTLNILNHFRL